MKELVRIGLIGDFNPDVRAHGAIPKALAFAGEAAGVDVREEWIATRAIGADAASQMGAFDGLWCVPGSPYENMDGVLAAIRFARERGVPFVGTCGGFQHAILEIARDVAGIAGADHEESSPDAPERVISRLACSLVRVERTVRLVPGTRLAALYETSEATEGYQCNFGLNPKYLGALEKAGVCFSAKDEEGDVRGMEIPTHPFFVGTLFQFELSALAGRTHPVTTGFVRAAARGLRG